MLWGQGIKLYTDHKNLTRDALGLTSDRVYHWWLLLEEYAPEIMYIKGTTTEVSLNFTSNTYVNHTVSHVSQPRLRIHKQMEYWNVYIKY
jgi:hypothetical protein